MTVTREDPTHCIHCGSEKIFQDPDVLDTWFSSGLWPFSTLGWPEETPDLKYFYPTAVLETGYDILFFWVARMIMSGIEYTGEVPFNTVYLHGLIRDENGRKMSKTYGNVIDPLEVMDELGTDALRFTLLVGSTPGNDMNLSLKKVEANRNFANKIWNAGRFILGVMGQVPRRPTAGPDWTLADSWIWARLQVLIRDVERLFGNFQYGEAGRQIYDFFWSDFADWYLEIAKLQITQGGNRAFYTAYTLTRVLDLSLRMLHPFTPFITEALWGYLRQGVIRHFGTIEPYGFGVTPLQQDWTDALIVASWPSPRLEEDWENKTLSDFNLVQEIVRAVRNLRAEMNVPAARRIAVVMSGGEKTPIIESQADCLAVLAGLDPENIQIFQQLMEKPENHAALVVGPVEIFLPIAGMVDTAAERRRLEKDLNEVESQVDRLAKLLASPFAEKAPPAVVQKERDRLETFRETASKIQLQLQDLKK